MMTSHVSLDQRVSLSDELSGLFHVEGEKMR
jgi:hypothetical protein